MNAQCGLNPLKNWCKKRRDLDGKVVNVYRVNVAQRILDKREDGIVAPGQRRRLQQLDTKLASIFEKATHLLGATTES